MPCVLLDLLEVAGRYPTLVITLLVLLFLSTGPILRALALLSGLWANGDGLSFLGWRIESATGHATLWSETRGARRGGSGSHQQLLQLLLDAGQGGSPVEEGTELVALGWDRALLGTGLMLASPRALVLWGDAGGGSLTRCCPWALRGCVLRPQSCTLECCIPLPYLGGQVEAGEVQGGLGVPRGGAEPYLEGAVWGVGGALSWNTILILGGWVLPYPGAPSGGRRGRRSRPAAGR